MGEHEREIRISSEARWNVSQIKVLGSGLIHRNPMPHLRSRHAYFPSLVALEDGKLLCAMDIGSAFEAVDVRSYVCRSDDGGITWTEPQLMFEPDEGSHRVSTTCRISRMPEGHLTGLACLFDRSREGEGLANPRTEGFVRTTMALVHSHDQGRSWSSPAPIGIPDGWSHFETCSPVIPVREGRRLIPTSYWNNWEGQCPQGANRAVVLLSDDGGKNWSRTTPVMGGPEAGFTGWEQKQVMLDDGRLMAVCWCYLPAEKRNTHNHFAFSRDGGSSFELARPSPLLGETCTPAALPGNHVLCVYRRGDVRGLWAHLARIDGDAWEPLADEPLWGTSVESHGSTEQGMLAAMATLRFGCPSVLHLGEGEIFAAFWCVEDCVSNIRWLRMKVST